MSTTVCVCVYLSVCLLQLTIDLTSYVIQPFPQVPVIWKIPIKKFRFLLHSFLFCVDYTTSVSITIKMCDNTTQAQVVLLIFRFRDENYFKCMPQKIILVII